MKRNKLYYILFVLYILATAFVLYVNGIFTGNVASFLNLAINGVFLLVMVMFIYIVSFIAKIEIIKINNELAGASTVIS